MQISRCFSRSFLTQLVFFEAKRLNRKLQVHFRAGSSNQQIHYLKVEKMAKRGLRIAFMQSGIDLIAIAIDVRGAGNAKIPKDPVPKNSLSGRCGSGNKKSKGSSWP